MKTTKFFSFSSLIFLLLSSAPAALAVEARPTYKAIRQETREEVRTTVRPTITAIRETTKTERQGVLTEAKKQVVTKIYNNLKNSLAKRYITLNNALTKIQAKVTAKAAANKDVTGVNKTLAQVTTTQATYTTDMAALDAKFNEIIAGDKPWTKVAELRAAGKKVETDLQTIRKLEVEALKAVVKL